MDVYVPHRREILSLDPRKVITEMLPEIDRGLDVREDILKLTESLEAQIARLRETYTSGRRAFSQEDLEKLSDIRNELNDISQA